MNCRASTGVQSISIVIFMDHPLWVRRRNPISWVLAVYPPLVKIAPRKIIKSAAADSEKVEPELQAAE